MRLARPYPCCGPIVANVRKTINERVPSQTSVLSAMVIPIGYPYIAGFLWDCNMSRDHATVPDFVQRQPTTSERSQYAAQNSGYCLRGLFLVTGDPEVGRELSGPEVG